MPSILDNIPFFLGLPFIISIFILQIHLKSQRYKPGIVPPRKRDIPQAIGMNARSLDWAGWYFAGQWQ